jgi:ERCC4-type nuclease
MILIVDQNEKDMNPDVVSSLKKNFSNVIIANLPHHEYGGIKVTSGDINIPLDDGSLLAIERKTPPDFLGSIPDRHIFNQVETMAKHAKYSAVIVTGGFTYGQKDDMCYILKQDGERDITNWNGKDVRGAITAIQYSGCPVIFCPSSRYCQTISELYTTVNKPDVHQAIVKRRIITFPPVDDRVQFIAQLPGVGLKSAESLMKWVRMMEGDITTEDEYCSIALALHWITIMVQIDKGSRPAGWGATKILTIRKFLGLESNQYLGLNSEVQEITE